MDKPRASRFGLGIYWPDDYTDYLVHFHEPFEVFRIELDRDSEGPILFWVAPDSPFELMGDEAFETFARAARKFLGLSELIPLGSNRQIELRTTEVPFPPILMTSNRSDKFYAIVGLGDEPFTAYISADENDPLISDIEIGFSTESPSIATELGDYAESFYNEFYDRQDALDKNSEHQQQQQRHHPGMPRGRLGSDEEPGFSHN
ncbi:hypothetical protein ASA1KI_04890 [Opitutales bacterium ASA1]|uniref:hypothetical protein n=1 Tax=Congregicoccus parvus TaxID=3081749 RepID=UPI002B299DD5|nr:hypothetical protein ASA1KI_04890 [Opitutales bacterium ASA1]